MNEEPSWLAGANRAASFHVSTEGKEEVDASGEPMWLTDATLRLDPMGGQTTVVLRKTARPPPNRS
jgi:hypothetical protein